MHEKLIHRLSEKITLSESDITLCKHYFKYVETGKNSIVDEADSVPSYLYFICSGFMRLFYYDEKGDEITTLISGPDNFVAPFLSFIHQKKSLENTECITECQLLRISREDLVTLINTSDPFKTFSLIIFEQAIAMTAMRANDLATLSAEQRYKKLLSLQPSVVHQVPIQYIASFLGIKSQSLSRIRRQIIP